VPAAGRHVRDPADELVRDLPEESQRPTSVRASTGSEVFDEEDTVGGVGQQHGVGGDQHGRSVDDDERSPAEPFQHAADVPQLEGDPW
jgi:hypothetical protein